VVNEHGYVGWRDTLNISPAPPCLYLNIFFAREFLEPPSLQYLLFPILLILLHLHRLPNHPQRTRNLGEKIRIRKSVQVQVQEEVKDEDEEWSGRVLLL